MAYIKYKDQKFKYKFCPLYEGIKELDKDIAMRNLVTLKEVADEYGFRFYLAYGTLLGAVREHDFIAHDEDIDLAAELTQLDVLMAMLSKLIERGFKIARWDDRGFISIIRDNEYIDIYLFREMSPKMMICCGEPIPRKFFDDTSTLLFRGYEFFVPNQFEELLVFLYGNDWKVPVVWNDYTPSRMKKIKAYVITYIKYYVPKCLLKPYFARKEKKMYNKYVEKGRIQQYL